MNVATFAEIETVINKLNNSFLKFILEQSRIKKKSIILCFFVNF